MQEVYLDNSATTKAYDEVVKDMEFCLKQHYGNPSSIHRKGIQAEKLVKEARCVIASALKVDEQEIVFTSGGTEANNIAVSGSIDRQKRRGSKIITAKTEHPSVLNVFKEFENRGYEVVYLNVNNQGILELPVLEENLSEDTILVSIMHVNNETGSVQPVQSIGKAIKERYPHIIYHVDGVQAFTKIPLYPKKLNADLVSLSAHKIHGPKGIGCLYIKKGTGIRNIVFGGGQEFGIRSGTENVPGIWGMKRAVEICLHNMEEKVSYIRGLKYELTESIMAHIPEAKLLGPDIGHGAPHIVNISFFGFMAEVIVHSLEEHNIYISTGSACSSRKTAESHVLSAMGLDKKTIQGAVRFSFGHFNTRQQIDYTVDKLKEVLSNLKIYRV